MKLRSSWVPALLLAGCGGSELPPPPPATASADVPEAPLTPPSGEPPRREVVPGPGAPDGYRPSTGERPGGARYDEVGYASWYGEETSGSPTASGERFDPSAMTAAHTTLPLGSAAEVTALDSGKTVLVRINDRWDGTRGRIIDLSRGAAQALGLDGRSVAAVRVRSVTPLAADAAALAAGKPASVRADAPPAVLAALRKKLPPAPAGSAPPPPRRDATRPPPPARAGRQGYLVQVAALSSAARAQAVAGRLGGRVVPGGRLYRVQLGPFSDAAAAERGRAEAARAGFGDARVIPSN